MDAQEQPQENRIESMRNIEKMIGEIGSIFQRLGNIVQMHEVMIDRIDRNTD
jgi:t-SNARE complex subunit (syntaxin)